MAQHDLGGECSRAHSGFALGGVSGLRAVASGTLGAYASQQTSTSPGTLHGYILGALNINIPYVDWLYDVLNIIADVLSIAGLALALCAPGGPKRILITSCWWCFVHARGASATPRAAPTKLTASALRSMCPRRTRPSLRAWRRLRPSASR